MALQTARAHASAASSALTNSSGCTCTLACPAGATLYLAKVIILHGSALVLAQGDLTVTGLTLGSLLLPVIQVTQDTRAIELDFSASNTAGVPASGADTDIVLSVPALLGGAETTVVLIGESY